MPKWTLQKEAFYLASLIKDWKGDSIITNAQREFSLNEFFFPHKETISIANFSSSLWPWRKSMNRENVKFRESAEYQK